jgi:hypothetical protein
MNQENRPPMKNDPAVAAPKDPLVDRVVLLVDPRGPPGAQAVLLVGPRDPLVDRAVLLVGPRDPLVDRAVLLVGPRDPLVDRAVLLVDPRGPPGAQAVLLAGPGDHPAKKSSEPDPPPAREQPQVQANGESLFTEIADKEVFPESARKLIAEARRIPTFALL